MSGLFLPLQHRQIVQKNGHEILALEFAFSDEPAEPHGFREDRILSKAAGDLPIPGLLRLRPERGFQFRQVFFDLAQPTLHLLNRLRHGVIV
jgi:hypothetical protein